MPKSTRPIKPSPTTPVFAAVSTAEEQLPQDPNAVHQLSFAGTRVAASECWMPAGPGTMPPYELAVIAWDNSRRKPCVVWLDPDVQGWLSQEDGSKLDDGAITQWRYCHAPDGIASEGAAP
jgi:hypothetical protein